VLVLHAADDHYVPLDFALAAVARHPAWEIAVLDHGGHYPQVSYPTDWLAVVVPWLERHAPDQQ
jgi:pimeloyl-ACP methyl ester carboxylesterase